MRRRRDTLQGKSSHAGYAVARIITEEQSIPFTPFHFGPGLFVKALVPRRFWLSSFVAANVLIDIEVLYYLRLNERPLHRGLHTYLGATLAGITAGAMMWGAVRAVRRFLRARHDRIEFPIVPRGLSELTESTIAGIVGGVSHVFLDSLTHADMHPFRPFADGNALAGTVSVGALHVGCAVSGFFGLILWLLLREPRID